MTDEDNLEALAFGRSTTPRVLAVLLSAGLLIGLGWLLLAPSEAAPQDTSDAGAIADAGVVEATDGEARAVRKKRRRARKKRRGSTKRRRAGSDGTAREPATDDRSAAAEPVAEVVEMADKLSGGDVRRHLKRRSQLFYACYKAKLKADRAAGITKAARGKVAVQFTVAPQGHVSRSRVTLDTLGAPDVQRCVLDAFRPLRFEATHQGAKDLVYTFVFEQN